MEFLSPRYLSEAFEAMDKGGRNLKICAGMTHLLRFYPRFPEELTSKFDGLMHVGDLAALSESREESGKYSIGSTARISSLVEDDYLARYAAAVREAAALTSTPQIRNRRTVGGEVAWGSYHSPLVSALWAMGAKVKVRTRGKNGSAGQEETLDLAQFYRGTQKRLAAEGKEHETRSAVTGGQDLILRFVLPAHQPGQFSFFRGLIPKIHTENSGVVLSVSGSVQNNVIERARVVASGVWMDTMDEELPLQAVRMNDTYIFEKLYTFCDRYNFDSIRRGGPPGSQLGLIVFGLLKEGFSTLLAR